MATNDEEAPYVRPDVQFFRRYFQCFDEFIAQLLDVNYNAIFQVGGKQKKRLTKRRRTNKKRKTNRNKLLRKV